MRATLQSAAVGTSAEAHHLMCWHGRLGRNGDRMAQKGAIKIFAELGLRYRIRVRLNDMYGGICQSQLQQFAFPANATSRMSWHEIALCFFSTL